LKNTSRIILGINYLGHDASASLFIDGQLIAAIEEERFKRFHKHFGGFPVNSINFCLEEAKIDLASVTDITYYIDPNKLININSLKFAFSPLYSIGRKIFFASRILYFLHCKTLRLRFKKYFPQLNQKTKFSFIGHHDAHLASAFFASSFSEADLISIDGIGEWESTVMAHGKDRKILRSNSILFPHSIGFLYSAITRHLGFRVNNDEYKVMGLAGYGDPERFRKLMKRIVQFKEDGTYTVDENFLSFGYDWGKVSKTFIKESSLAPKKVSEPLEQIHKDMAASLQNLTEETAIHLARHLQNKSGSKKLCLSGGVALNCLMNSRILEETEYDEIFIQPACYDASGSMGGALWLQHQILNEPRKYTMSSAYLGSSASDESILQALRQFSHISFRKCENICKDVVDKLLEQKIIGWFQGKMEWGPRALGNRSILADPRNRKMMDHVNDKIKHREDFRPFAPSCKLEKFKDYFSMSVPSPFMLLISKVKEDKREIIPAVTHVDGTARYHTVDKTVNSLFWNLLDEFEGKSGVPVLLNTSFNVNGETIVRTPKDAIECFLSTGIDLLAIGNYLVEKS